MSGEFYALLGDKDKVFAPMRFLGFNIYLHDKGDKSLGLGGGISSTTSGQFWPGLEMGRIGLSDVFFLAKNYEFDGSFVMTQKTLIDKEDNRCQMDPNYSFQVNLVVIDIDSLIFLSSGLYPHLGGHHCWMSS